LEEENIAPLETANYHKRLAREEDPRSEPNAEDKVHYYFIFNLYFFLKKENKSSD
jgi:hypothetical protein